MAQAITEETTYRALWRARQANVGDTLPAWVGRLRADALERFERQGFPTTREEDWKYTNVAPIAKATFNTSFEHTDTTLDAAAVAPFLYPEAQGSRLVFVNGNFNQTLSTFDGLSAGAVVVNLADALSGEHEGIVRAHLARTVAGDADRPDGGFASLNTAFLGDGAFVYLPRGVRCETPIHLLFLADAETADVAAFPRILIVAEQESEVTIIESYETARGDHRYLTNALVEVFVGAQARVTHYKLQRESEAAYHIAETLAQLERNAVYDLTTITLGARLSRHGINLQLAHEGAECWVDGLYLVGDGQHADTHSLIDHRAPRCASHQIYKGILDGKSRAVFNGKVFVHQDAQQTDAKQTNKNLLLSKEARVDTKPQLEIFADDVKCAHGATVGQLEEEELFYLASRGLHPDLARNLLTYGFAEELVTKIKIESIKRQLDEAILNRLHARLEV